MSIRNGVDPDVFQTLLSNAFTVQESGLNAPSLSALIEIQRFATSEQCGLEQMMHLVSERVLAVSNASGTAIGLLDRNRHELVYRAASGTATSLVGRRVPAVLSVSSAQESRREILRVENAESDPRVQAEICRQFGASSLLMLPIYSEHALVGILQVLFSGAHSFQEQEVRAYRLIVAALEEGMLRSERAQKQGVISALNPVRDDRVISHEPQQSSVLAVEVPAIVAEAAKPGCPDGPSSGDLNGLTAPAQAAGHSYQSIPFQQLVSLSNGSAGAIRTLIIWARSGNMRRPWAAVAVVILLAVSVWIFHDRHFSTTRIGASSSATRDADFRLPEPTSLMNQDPMVPADTPDEATSLTPRFKRVRVGPDEVDYVAEDVTIRTFERRSSKLPIRNGAHEVDFGDDVTVRYFAKSPAVASQPTSTPATADTN